MRSISNLYPELKAAHSSGRAVERSLTINCSSDATRSRIVFSSVSSRIVVLTL